MLSALKVVEFERILFHELHESERLEKTGLNIIGEGYLKNPPLAMEIDQGRNLILDGAHRTLSLKRIKCKRLLIQVVTDSQLNNDSWNHLVPLGDWLYQLKSDTNIIWTDRLIEASAGINIIHSSGKKEIICSNDNLSNFNLLHRVVNSYSNDFPIKRIPNNIQMLPEHNHVLLNFPILSMQEIKQIVDKGMILPAGITRFLINGRILNLRIPLNLLTESFFNKTKWNNLLENWSTTLRFYAEPVFIVE